MAILRLIAVGLFFFLITILVPALMLMLAYYIIPAQLTLTIMGTVFGLIALLAFLFYAFLFVFGVMTLGLRSKTASERIESYPENIQMIRESLEEQGFRHLGNQYGDKFFSKEKRLNLIYLDSSGRVIVELHQKDNGEANLTCLSIWDRGQFLLIDVQEAGFTIIKNHYRFISINDASTIYEKHMEQLSELEAQWGKAAQIKSLEQLQEFEIYMSRVSAADIMYQGAVSAIRPIVGTAIPVMAFGALAIQGAFYFGFMQEAENMDKNAPTILFLCMGAFVFLSYQFLLKPSTPAKAK